MRGFDGRFGILLTIINGSEDLWRYALPVAIVIATTIVGRLVEFLVRHRLGALASKTAWRGDDAIIRALRHKITISSVLLGVALSLNYIPWQLTASQLDIVHKGLLVGFLLVLTMFAADALGGAMLATQNATDHPAVSIVDTLVRAAIYVVGAIVILQQVFHYDLGPALAALGVAGLAVSLALQSTLTDLISGIQVIAARQVRPGQYVRLSTGEEGYVTDIGWRTTTIRQLANNLIIVPNSRMTSTILVNYYTPDPSMAVLVDVGVAYGSDLDKVERVTIEVAKEVLASVKGGVLDNDPFIRYNAFADSSINFTVILRGSEYTDQYLIKHEFVRRLAQRYREEEIQIPFPMRTVQMQFVDAVGQVHAPPWGNRPVVTVTPTPTQTPSSEQQ
ncbi:MAG: mechanosensitive ion channel family protein [Nitrososphaerota archaeon]